MLKGKPAQPQPQEDADEAILMNAYQNGFR
jgi:hypothetical protein